MNDVTPTKPQSPKVDNRLLTDNRSYNDKTELIRILPFFFFEVYNQDINILTTMECNLNVDTGVSCIYTLHVTAYALLLWL